MSAFLRAAEYVQCAPYFEGQWHPYSCGALDSCGASLRQKRFYADLFKPDSKVPGESWFGNNDSYVNKQRRVFALLLAHEAWKDRK